MCGLVSLLLLHRKVTFVDFFPNTRVFLFFLMHIVVSLIFSFMLDLIQFQHSSARHLYSCFFLTVLQLRVCFFFFCVNTTRVLFSHVFCSEDSHFLTGGHIVPVSPFFLLRGQHPKHVRFFRVCVFHFIIMQKIYYIRVVFVCCCWFRSRSREGTNL